MAEQNWITDGSTYAIADSAAAFDGWEPSGPPPADGWVWIWREGVADPARWPLENFTNLWGPRGWMTGPPPGGEHPCAPKPAAVPTAPKPTKPAAGVKEETGA